MGGMGKKTNNYILCQNLGHFISWPFVSDYNQILHLVQDSEESARMQFFIDYIFFHFLGIKIKYIKSQINSLVSSALDISFISQPIDF